MFLLKPQQGAGEEKREKSPRRSRRRRRKSSLIELRSFFSQLHLNVCDATVAAFSFSGARGEFVRIKNSDSSATCFLVCVDLNRVQSCCSMCSSRSNYESNN